MPYWRYKHIGKEGWTYYACTVNLNFILCHRSCFTDTDKMRSKHNGVINNNIVPIYSNSYFIYRYVYNITWCNIWTWFMVMARPRGRHFGSVGFKGQRHRRAIYFLSLCSTTIILEMYYLYIYVCWPITFLPNSQKIYYR